MPLLKTVKTPTGASLSFHRISRIMADPYSEHAVALLTVHSWPDAETYSLTGGTMAAWEWTVPIPLAPIQTGGALIDLCEETVIQLSGDLLPFGGASRTPLPSDLAGAAARQWAAIKQSRALMSEMPIEVDGCVYDADPASVAKIMGAIQGLEISGAESIVWTLADNTTKLLTLQQLRQVGVAIMLRTDACFQTARALRDAIDAATTPEEVAAIGWPS